MFPNKKAIERSFTLQHEVSDCGAACLLGIIKFYGGRNNIDNIRRLSGTTVTGTTLLGLYQTANQLGFDAEGCEASIESLAGHGAPCILYVTSNHYVICYGTFIQNNEEKFIIGDPAQKIIFLSKDQLNDIWLTKKCLQLIPNNSFKKSSQIKDEKWQWIKVLLKEDRSLFLIAIFLGIGITVLGVSLSIFSQKLIDDIIPKKAFVKLNVGIVSLFFILIIKEGLTALRQFFLLRQAKDLNIRIVDFFYRHLLQLPKPFFDTRKIGELTARLNDTSRIQSVITQLVGNTIIDALVVLVSASFVFFYSWSIGVFCIGILPVYYLLIYWHHNQIIVSQRSVMGSYASAESNYISTLQGIETIKNFNREIEFSASNKSIYKTFQEKVFSLGLIQLKLSFLANSFSVVFLSSILLITGHQVMNGHLKVGELMAILGMCGSMLPGVARLAMISIPLNEARIAFDRMFEFTCISPEQNNSGTAANNFFSLAVKNISFRFAGRSLTLKKVSLEVSKGEIIAIMGENGCGKSTLMQILLNHYRLEGGQITINNKDLSDYETNSRRRLIGSVPQNIHIFNGTILENIAFADAADKPHDVLDFLHKYGFSPFIDSLPYSFMTIVGEEGINLSGGQKQIIALARALYLQPQLLILDEATAAMDRLSEQFVLKLLRDLRGEMGIIFITHRLHVLKSFCDRIYILEDGLISNRGTHEQLLKTSNLYSLYWNDLIAQDCIID